MSALQERNERVKYARELGVEKPQTLKKQDLEDAITVAENFRDLARIERQTAKQDDPFDDIDPAVEGDHLTQESVADVLAEREATREAWLLSAVDKLVPLLEQAGATNIRQRRLMVSVSFPSKTIRKRIGECWAAVASPGGDVNHLFVSPLIDDAVTVLGVLAHELVHADDNCESKHNGHFRRVATALGLTGKMTETNVGEDLKPILKDIAEELGPYPHVKLRLGDGNVKVQTTRLLKVHCVDAECPYLEGDKGYTIRLTKKWVEIGLPACPCGAEMVVAE